MALNDIPGYGAYIARKQMLDQQPMQELQQGVQAMNLAALMKKQSNDNALATALAESEGNPEAALGLVLKSGNLDAAAKLAPIVESRRKAQPQGQPIGAGGLRLPDGTVVPPAARPADPNAHAPEIVRLQAAAAQYPEGHPMRQQIEARIKMLGERPQGVQVNMPASSDTMVGEDGKTYKVRIGKDGTVQAIPMVGPGGVALKPAGADKAPTEPGGQSPENAGKIAMAQQSVESIDKVRSLIFDEGGKLNRTLVGAMNLPVVAGLPGNSQARIARTAIRNAVEAKLRLETGAAATESEVERTLARFLPTVADTEESAKFKLDELQKFFKSSLSLTKGAPKPAAGGKPGRMRFDAQGNPVAQ
jgi:hypothetical protein